jgi:endonuclease G, mitochondrial
MIHPYWDMSILQVEGLPADHPSIRLSLNDARELAVGREIFVIGIPPSTRGIRPTQQKLFQGLYGIKRLQPGALQGVANTASFGKVVRAAAHDCSTLGGNSGSAIFDLTTGEVLALHFGGQYHEKNYGVPSSEMARDSRVVDTGASFGGRPSGDPNDWRDWWKRADSGERDEGTTDDGAAPQPAGQPPRRQVAPAGGDGSVTIEVPLRITISLGQVVAGGVTVRAKRESVVETGLEALQMPFHDTDYSTRHGYDPHFLEGADGGNGQVPMPKAADPSVLARVQGGGNVLHYQNFSSLSGVSRCLPLRTSRASPS